MKLRSVTPEAVHGTLLKPSLAELLRNKKTKKQISRGHFDARYRVKLLPDLPLGQKVWISALRQEGKIESRYESPKSSVIRSFLDNL